MSKRGYISIEGVQSPTDANGSVTVFQFIEDFYETAKRHRWKADMMVQAKEVLQNPEAIFEAFRQIRGEESLGYCYVGWPERVPNKAGLTSELRQDQVLAVYVDSEFNVWEWRVERCCDDGHTPLQPEGRFGRKLYCYQGDE